MSSLAMTATERDPDYVGSFTQKLKKVREHSNGREEKGGGRVGKQEEEEEEEEGKGREGGGGRATASSGVSSTHHMLSLMHACTHRARRSS